LIGNLDCVELGGAITLWDCGRQSVLILNYCGDSDARLQLMHLGATIAMLLLIYQCLPHLGVEILIAAAAPRVAD